MDYRKLGRSDLTVSSFGLGCVTFGREIDAESAFAIMDHALGRGITLFDTAEAYGAGASETVIGEWMASRKSRRQIVLATKVAGTLTRERVLSSVHASLQRLQTDVIDLLQVHHWDNQRPLEETLAALHALVEQGKVRAIGCSNYAAWQLCKSLWRQDVHGWSRFESIQSNYNLVTRDIEMEILPLCADQEVGIISYSPLGAGFLTGKYRQQGTVPQGTRFDVIPGHQNIYFKDDKFRTVEGLRTRAEEVGVSMIQLALAWVLRQPAITSVLIGARKIEHVDQAFEAEAWEMPGELYTTLSHL